jgi:hypothetical protein
MPTWRESHLNDKTVTRGVVTVFVLLAKRPKESSKSFIR